MKLQAYSLVAALVLSPAAVAAAATAAGDVAASPGVPSVNPRTACYPACAAARLVTCAATSPGMACVARFVADAWGAL